MVAGRTPIAVAALMVSLWSAGCTLSPERVGGAPEAELALAIDRVDRAIDATNICIANHVRLYDSPSITPGVVLDAALIECRPFFAAHRAAVRALAALQLVQGDQHQRDAQAEQEAERYAGNFRRIVRETGLAVLVQRRAAPSALAPPADEGELQL